MTLGEYLDSIKKSVTEASYDLRVSRSHVHGLVTNKFRPSLDMVDKVAVWSGFQVMGNDWMRVRPEPEAAGRKRKSPGASAVASLNE